MRGWLGRSALLALTLALACGDDDGAGRDAGVDGGVDGGRGAGGDAGMDASVDGGECSSRPDAAPPDLPDTGPLAPAPELDCGTPSFPEGTGLRRWPYLQSVTPTSARVAWTSTTGGRGVVRVAPSPDGPWTEVEASAESFPTARTDDSEDYVAFDATLAELEPSSAYCYEVVEDGTVLASNLTLRTGWVGAGAEEGRRPLRILAFGDSGSGNDDQRALRDVFIEEEFDLFLQLGDIAYGDGTFVELEQNNFAIYRDFLHRVPSWPTIGNHDDKTDRAQPYRDVYYLPEMALREEDQERYYSFDQGNVHFVSIDTNDATLIPIAIDIRDTVTDDMLDWLADDLAASDAEWKIVFFHHPPYTSSSRDPNGVVRQQVVPLLEAGGVDLVLAGHDHHYERTLPMQGGCVAQPDDTGITYIIAGAGGAGLRGDVTPQFWHAASDDTVHSYVRLTIHGCVARGEAVSAEGEVLDSFELGGC